jgi:hypothetical protein
LHPVGVNSVSDDRGGNGGEDQEQKGQNH